MKSKVYKYIEFLIIFVIAPLSFTFDYFLWLKMAIGIIGFLYVVLVLLKIESIKLEIAKNLNWKLFWKFTCLKLAGIITLTSIYTFWLDNENFLFMPFNKPLLWLSLMLVYSIFSVYPQELIFRTFFFQRYQSIIKSDTVLIGLNALVFCLAHLFFKNTLVLIMTFLGGVLFALTFKKTKSTLLVTIEHAIYGCWLFTIGMGEMLGFPN